MGIQNFPSALQPIIQQNFLETEFEKFLSSALGYRMAASRESFRTNIGETLTKTRPGLKVPVTTPLNPSGNTNLDNGLTPTTFSIEQYTATLRLYGDAIDLNMVTNRVGIVDQFLHNVKVNATQAAQSLDRLARNRLFSTYIGYNTNVRVTLGAPGTTLSVDDITGFTTTLVNGQPVPVSASAPLNVVIGSNTYIVTAATADVSNVSSRASVFAPGNTTLGLAPGISGTLTTTVNVTVADGTIGNGVVAVNAPIVLRPRGSANPSSYTLATGDNFTMSIVLDAVALLRRNAVPSINGAYNVHLDPISARQLFADPDFKQLFQGSDASKEFRMGSVIELLDCRFIPTTEAPVMAHQTIAGAFVRRPIVLGEAALIECDFAGMAEANIAPADSIITMADGVVMVTREPLDRLQQIISQSWYWIGDFVGPTDFTVTTAIVPTASVAFAKRGVVIEHIS